MMQTIRLLLSALAALVALGLPMAVQAGQLTGTLLIRERIALPRDAVLELLVVDASAPNSELQMEQQRRTLGGPLPQGFRIDYDGTRYQPGQRFLLRATISVQGQVLFQLEPPARLAMDGGDPPLQLLLTATGAVYAAPALPPPGAVPLPPPVAAVLPRPGATMPPPAQALPFGPLPARYVGDLPGAGGAVRWELELLADGSYRLAQTPLNRRDNRRENRRVDDNGRWTWQPSRGQLVLNGGLGASYLEPVAGGALRRLDAQGQRLASGNNDLLQRQSAAGPGLVVPAPASPVALTGMFTTMADAPRIVLCSDGRSLPVAMDGEYRNLEAAYRQARLQPGQPVLVELRGRILPRASAEFGRQPEATVAVDRFDAIWPRESCGPSRAEAPLRGTYWRLVRLAGRAAEAAERQREAHLMISADGTQLSGSGGCNRMNGSVQLSGGRIAIGPIAATRMACNAGQAQESALFDALERAASWKVTGSHLELFDARGVVLARFEAGAPR